MRILVVNPNTTESMTAAIGEACRAVAAKDTEVTAINPAWGPPSIETYAEDHVAAAAMLQTIAEHRDDYDAFVIACAGDPGLHAARQITDAPVIGIAEAAMHMACLVAHRFSIVTVIDSVIPMLRDMVALAGISQRCASIRATSLSVLEIEEDFAHAERVLVEESRRAVNEDGAEAIVLGCAGMGPLDKRLQDELGVPVLDGCGCAITLAEACHRYGITTSKAGAYAMDAGRLARLGIPAG
ncbi:aspartate/glutamate racemase family protein [Pseudonocardia sp. MH-G8]|uniref:aspartate/glutamate racemase family protein n=1 Tax=Pseudonocardia sp. MH-G8 TaxID=1854588 RepID=UPI000BA08430|nr:aspartate/glutamate racemase family protein [Pseudonocardia sp. MH-G8]OZM75765.1 Asp/Glu/hydantoin racemase [Pseudonocardia sp. MH-G8]